MWFFIVLFVALQMAYYFRPLLIPGPFHSGQRGLFMEGVGSMLGREDSGRD